MRADTINFVHMPPIRPGRIILLNGTSSSGKTSIAEQFGDLPTIRVGDLQAYRPGTGIDQRETADAVWVAGGVQHRDRATSRVSQQIDPIPPEMRAQRLDIVDQPITSVTRRVRRYGRFPGLAQVKQHQRAVRGQPAQVTEVCRGLHGPPGRQISGLPSPARW